LKDFGAVLQVCHFESIGTNGRNERLIGTDPEEFYQGIPYTEEADSSKRPEA